MMTLLEIKALLYMAKCFYNELEQTLFFDLTTETRKIMLEVSARDAEDLAEILRRYAERENQTLQGR